MPQLPRAWRAKNDAACSPVAARDRLEEIFLHAAAGENEQRYSIAQDSKGPNEVKDERFLAVVVGVQKTDVGIQAGADAGFFHEGT
jgi:hypothetical protein